MVQRGHHFAIVDEVDSILIDEARTPLIISGPAEESTDLYYEVDRIIPKLKKGEVHQGQVKTEDRDRLEASGDYTVDEKNKTVTLTEAGMATPRSCSRTACSPAASTTRPTCRCCITSSRGCAPTSTTSSTSQYMIKDGQVVIVDEFTGRLMPGRRWSDGLHQAVEAKEGVKIERENQTLATITFQNFFRKYKKLSGMTGTAETEAPEFAKIYNLDVDRHPDQPADAPHRGAGPRLPHRRREVERDRRGHHRAPGRRAARRWSAPCRSRSRSASPACSRSAASKHVVLNAKYHAQEAEIVAQAGRKGGVTIATNMAGRGTDILLGGNAEHMARQQALAEGVAEKLAKGEEKYVDDDEFVNFFMVDSFYRVQDARTGSASTAHFKQQCADEHEEVVALGGLHIVGTERHEARRIDNQLRGRAGRQGDPGSSRFYLSLEDDLMRIFGSDRISGLMQRLGMEEGVPIEHGMVSRAIERAQKQVEAQNFSVRKHLLEYDDVMNKQRESVYTLRREILEGKVHLSEDEVADIRGYVMATAEELLDDKMDQFAGKPTWTRTNGTCPALQRELTQLFALDDDDYDEIEFDAAEHRRAARRALGARSRRSTPRRSSIVPREHPDAASSAT